jgi:membrane-associated phospholipid phosphatase
MSHPLKHIIFTFILLVICLNSNAQIKEKKWSWHKNCVHCTLGDHSSQSPYSVSFKKEVPYLLTGLGLLGSGLFMKSINEEAPFTIDELNNLDASKINSFDRGAAFNNSSTARRNSNYTLMAGALLPLYFLSNHNTRSDFIPLVVMGAEVYTITSTLALNSKYAFNRTRPLAYNPEFSDELRTGKTSKLSFFSGHTAQTAGFSFFTAKIVSDYHPEMRKSFKILIWSGAVALPALTGYFRIKGGKHYNTDVITGFAVGAAVGWLIPHLHKKKESKLTVAPFNFDSANGLSLTLKL